MTAINTSINVTLQRYLLLKWLILSIFVGNIWTPLIMSKLIKDFTHEYTCVRFWLFVLANSGVLSSPDFRAILLVPMRLLHSVMLWEWTRHWENWSKQLFSSTRHIAMLDLGSKGPTVWSNCQCTPNDVSLEVELTANWIAGSRWKNGCHFDDNDPQMMLEYCKMAGISSSTY